MCYGISFVRISVWNTIQNVNEQPVLLDLIFPVQGLRWHVASQRAARHAEVSFVISNLQLRSEPEPEPDISNKNKIWNTLFGSCQMKFKAYSFLLVPRYLNSEMPKATVDNAGWMHDIHIIITHRASCLLGEGLVPIVYSAKRNSLKRNNLTH